MPIENLEDFYDLFEVNLRGEYKANSLAGMTPNNYSYHAVRPINIDETRVNISIWYGIIPCISNGLSKSRYGNLENVCRFPEEVGFLSC